MKKLFVVLLMASFSFSYSQSLKIIYGNMLYYQNGKTLIKVLQREHSDSFEGYDIIDNTHIFLAYQPEEYAEAMAIISVYNIKTHREQKIQIIGDTGESFFVYNNKNDLVVFNWFDGIFVFKLHDKNNNIIKKLPYVIQIKKGDGQDYNPFWANTNTIVYQVWDKRSQKYKIKYLRVSENLISHGKRVSP